jgi:hypothetical protein
MASKYKGNNHLIFGVGINDLPNEPTRGIVNGKRWNCPKYAIWKDILRRCYRQDGYRFVAYKGVTVCPDWIYRSKFNEWLNSQPQNNWQDLQIDKDLLVKGNKVYGSDTCCFLTGRENLIFRPHSTKLGSVSRIHQCPKRPWRGRKNIGVVKYVGYFSTKEEAEFVAMRESIPHVIEIANANPHQFIRDAMYRWIDDWKSQLLLLESAFQKLGEQNNGTLQDHLC